MRRNEGVAVRDVPACPLCETQGRELYRDLRDRYWDAPGTWGFLECPRCRHVWLNPLPEPEDIPKLYGSYYTHRPPVPTDVSPSRALAIRAAFVGLGYDSAALTSVDRQVAWWLRHVPPLWDAFAREARFLPASPGGILLDVGCGEGSFLRRMGDLGWRVVGLEPDPRAAAVARSGSGADIIEGPIEGTDLGRARFDAITMIHVIEHVRDPIAALRAVCSALKPGGTFAALTPNAEGRGHRVFGSAWFHLDPPRHLHLFRSRNLRSVAERAGLSVKRLWTSPLDALRVHHVSAALRARGRFDLRDMSWAPTLRDRAFRIAEYGIAAVRREAGEEIVLIATKGEAA